MLAFIIRYVQNLDRSFHFSTLGFSIFPANAKAHKPFLNSINGFTFFFFRKVVIMFFLFKYNIFFFSYLDQYCLFDMEYFPMFV